MPRRRTICYQVREDPTPLSRRLCGGAQELSDLELVAAVIGHPGADADALQLAAKLLDGGPATQLQRMTARRLRGLVGEPEGGRLLAALELGRRAIRGTGQRVLSSPKHVLEHARAYAGAQKEHFLAIHLNARHMPHFLEVVSIGTLSASLVHPREVFRQAIAQGSACLILAHNHPSGDPTPSADDIEITARLARVGELVGIEVLDHVVLAQERYFSFREEGLMGAQERQSTSRDSGASVSEAGRRKAAGRSRSTRRSHASG